MLIEGVSVVTGDVRGETDGREVCVLMLCVVIPQMTTDKSQFANAPIIQGQMIAQPMAQPILVPGQQMHAADGAPRSEVSDQLARV